MRRDCQPYLIDSAKNHYPLARVHYKDRKIAESFLQEAIHASPSLLPVNRLDSDFYPLVSLGREIANIDNLLISPTGKLSIVETKLWRNPQASREVLAQAIEYANTLWEMDYTEFEALLGTALPPAPIKEKSLFTVVSELYPDQVLDEAEFHDEVQKCLNNAEFMLLIVGDGIRENLEGLADILYQPQMHFKFGLIEIQIYESPVIPYSVFLPNIVAHSTELHRTVVKIEGDKRASILVNIQEPSNSKSRRVLTEEDFFAELADAEAKPMYKDLIEFGIELGANPLWRASSVGLRLPDPRGISKYGFTLFLLNLDGTISDYYLGTQLESSKGDVSIAADRAQALSKMYQIPCSKQYQTLKRAIPWKKVMNNLNDFKSLIKETVEKINTMQSNKIGTAEK